MNIKRLCQGGGAFDFVPSKILVAMCIIYLLILNHAYKCRLIFVNTNIDFVQVRAIDAELAEMDRIELRGEHELEEGVRRNVEEGGGARRAGHPQSCNLEQLYHESIPMDRALSHSGPPAFGGSGNPPSLRISQIHHPHVILFYMLLRESRSISIFHGVVFSISMFSIFSCLSYSCLPVWNNIVLSVTLYFVYCWLSIILIFISW